MWLNNVIDWQFVKKSNKQLHYDTVCEHTDQSVQTLNNIWLTNNSSHLLCTRERL